MAEKDKKPSLILKKNNSNVIGEVSTFPERNYNPTYSVMRSVGNCGGYPVQDADGKRITVRTQLPVRYLESDRSLYVAAAQGPCPIARAILNMHVSGKFDTPVCEELCKYRQDTKLKNLGIS